MSRPPARTCPKVRYASVLGLMFLLSGCASLPPAQEGLRPWEVAEIERQAERLRHSPHRVDDPALKAWLVELLHRIDPLAAPHVELFVLDLPLRQVDLVGGRLLRVRTGLLRALSDEAELVFVLAHELAHRSLGHVQAQQGRDWNPEAGEIEADREAQRALARLGYSVDAGSVLMRRLLGPVETPRDRTRIQARIAALEATGDARDGEASQREADPRFEALLAPYRR